MRLIRQALTVLIFTLIAAPFAQAGEIEDMIRKNTHFKTFSALSLNKNYRATLTIGKQTVTLDRAQSIELMKGQAGLISEFNVTDMKIRILDQNDRFVSVVYSYNFKAKSGSTITSGRLAARSILEKSPYYGWQFLFEAATQ